MEEQEKLLPCPFCGASQDSGNVCIVGGDVENAQVKTWLWVKCRACGAETRGDETPAESAKNWNRREARS